MYVIFCVIVVSLYYNIYIYLTRSPWNRNLVFFSFSRIFSGALLVPTVKANGQYTIYIYYFYLLSICLCWYVYICIYIYIYIDIHVSILHVTFVYASLGVGTSLFYDTSHHHHLPQSLAESGHFPHPGVAGHPWPWDLQLLIALVNIYIYMYIYLIY